MVAVQDLRETHLYDAVCSNGMAGFVVAVLTEHDLGYPNLGAVETGGVVIVVVLCITVAAHPGG
jgi:hypothetical protein